jgi:hypothetical protein
MPFTPSGQHPGDRHGTALETTTTHGINETALFFM